MVLTGFSIKSTETGRTEMTRTRAICVNAGLPLRSALPGRRSASDQRSGFETGWAHPSWLGLGLRLRPYSRSRWVRPGPASCMESVSRIEFSLTQVLGQFPT